MNNRLTVGSILKEHLKSPRVSKDANWTTILVSNKISIKAYTDVYKYQIVLHTIKLG